MAQLLLLSCTPSVAAQWRRVWYQVGHEVILAGCVDTAIDQLWTGGIDVLLVDLDLPPPRLLLTLHRMQDPPPLILISSSPEAPGLSARIGASAFVPKPCQACDILPEIARLARQPFPPFIDEEQTDVRHLPYATPR